MTINLLDTVIRCVREALNLSQHYPIDSSSRLRDDLGLDSMSTLSFLILLEEKIDGFTIDPDKLDAQHLETIGSVLEYIQQENSSKQKVG